MQGLEQTAESYTKNYEVCFKRVQLKILQKFKGVMDQERDGRREGLKREIVVKAKRAKALNEVLEKIKNYYQEEREYKKDNLKFYTSIQQQCVEDLEERKKISSRAKSDKTLEEIKEKIKDKRRQIGQYSSYLNLTVTCEILQTQNCDDPINALRFIFTNILKKSPSSHFTALVQINPASSDSKFSILAFEPHITVPEEVYSCLDNGDLKTFCELVRQEFLRECKSH
ncbi:unnamed protein product [Moneuplotes crassus]|uniref:Kinetochore protein SPC25 n=1 Tax=Euplotes crassus TaxID=5936 RepID=A0AAD1XLB5_EUPCR|nr:unnamed protein product [Moneuplotes crassus]